MKTDEYQAIVRGAGKRWREFWQTATNRHPTRSLSQLRTELEGLGIYDDSAQDKYLDAYKDLHGQVDKLGQFGARQIADSMAVTTIRELERSDDLWGKSRLDHSDDDVEPIEVADKTTGPPNPVDAPLKVRAYQNNGTPIYDFAD